MALAIPKDTPSTKPANAGSTGDLERDRHATTMVLCIVCLSRWTRWASRFYYLRCCVDLLFPPFDTPSPSIQRMGNFWLSGFGLRARRSHDVYILFERREESLMMVKCTFRSLISLFSLLLVLLAVPKMANAYVDPGSGAMLWQLAAATVIGSLFYLKRILVWIRGHFVSVPSQGLAPKYGPSDPSSVPLGHASVIGHAEKDRAREPVKP
jgi:hypothetical protein